jgi:hypothetical protein
LAYNLVESTIKVSVENPLSVKRFIQMKLSKCIGKKLSEFHLFFTTVLCWQLALFPPNFIFVQKYFTFRCR